MPFSPGRIRVKIVRGTYSALAQSVLSDGELCYATDQDKLYIVEGTTLTSLDYAVNSELIEKVQDIVGTSLIAGSGIVVNYNDASGQVTISASGGGGGITALAQATDVNVSGKVDKSVLVFDSTSNKFVANEVNTIVTMTDGGSF